MVSMTVEDMLAVLVSFVKVVQLTLDVSFNNIPPNHYVPVISCLSLLANIHASFFIQSTKSLAIMKVEEKDAEMVLMTVEDVLAVLVSFVKVVQLVLDVSFHNIPPNHCVPVISCLSLLANMHVHFFLQSTKSLAIMKVEEKDTEMVLMTMEDVLAVLVSFVKVVQLVFDVSFDNIPPNHCVPVISCLSLLANIHASFFLQSTKSLAIMKVEEKDAEMVSLIIVWLVVEMVVDLVFMVSFLAKTLFNVVAAFN
jgi:hypothetical protein